MINESCTALCAEVLTIDEVAAIAEQELCYSCQEMSYHDVAGHHVT